VWVVFCFRYIQYYRGDQIKEDEMGRALDTQEGKEKCVQAFGGKK
jgi:hypothetical protein